MPTGNINITKAGIKDADLLGELSVTTFRDTFGPVNRREDMDAYITGEMNAAKLAAELNDANNTFYIAWMGAAAVAFAKMRPIFTPAALNAGSAIEIERLYVRHEHHGQKIGTILMQHCIAYATSQKHDLVWLGVWERNHRAIRFYTKCGFEVFGSHPFVLGSDVQTDVLMKKKI
jgi:ribosomal protein S18 acetylase RimI-like enzyme